VGVCFFVSFGRYCDQFYFGSTYLQLSTNYTESWSRWSPSQSLNPNSHCDVLTLISTGLFVSSGRYCDQFCFGSTYLQLNTNYRKLERMEPLTWKKEGITRYLPNIKPKPRGDN
jgi:hypothetical protein